MDSEVIEPTGSETFAILSLGSDEIVCLFRERVSLLDDQSIEISLTHGETYFFDPRTGTRI